MSLEKPSKFTTDTLVPISLVVLACSFAYSWAKLESRVEKTEKVQVKLEQINLRLYRLELQSGIKNTTPPEEEH